jgi:hypothetical protein
MASQVNNTQPEVAMNASPLAFVFNGNEMIVQCTANTDDQAAAVNTLGTALRNYQSVQISDSPVLQPLTIMQELQ